MVPRIPNLDVKRLQISGQSPINCRTQHPGALTVKPIINPDLLPLFDLAPEQPASITYQQ